jgi:DNA-binding Xre family transcriptional regulator
MSEDRIHVGEAIKRKLKTSDMSITNFATKLNMERTNVYDIFKRASIDSALLATISQLLNHNFFELYTTPPPTKPYKPDKNGEIHIGSLIHEVCVAKRITGAELSRKIFTSRQNINKIFQRNSIDTYQLLKLCKALDHDFFHMISVKSGMSEDTSAMSKNNDGKLKVYLHLDISEIDSDRLIHILTNK